MCKRNKQQGQTGGLDAPCQSGANPSIILHLTWVISLLAVTLAETPTHTLPRLTSFLNMLCMCLCAHAYVTVGVYVHLYKEGVGPLELKLPVFSGYQTYYVYTRVRTIQTISPASKLTVSKNLISFFYFFTCIKLFFFQSGIKRL